MKTTLKILGKRVETGSKTVDRPAQHLGGTCFVATSIGFEEMLNRVIWKLIPATLKDFGISYRIFLANINQSTVLTSLN
jgi:phenylalanyl-tRNA synthetase beta subunit